MKNSLSALIHLSLLLALLLSLLPLPTAIERLQPYWLAVVMIYWNLTQPERSNVYVAFFYGVILDVLNGSLLGKHGFSLVAITYIVSKFSKQLKMTSVWQLTAVVVFLLFNDLIIRSAIDWLSDRVVPQWSALLPLLTSALIWPWLYYLLERIRIRRRA